MLRRLSLCALFLTTPVLFGQTPTQTWVTISQESSTTQVTLPAGTTYRFGDYANNRWSTPLTVAVPTTISPISMAGHNAFPFPDPDNGTVKELDILATMAPQTIAVTNLAVSPATTVSQIVPPLAPPAEVPVPPGTTYTLTLSNFAIAPGKPQNSLMLALVNAPPTHANQSWVGTQFDLTIDGVTLNCTYGQTFTGQAFTMNCTVPATSSSTGTKAGQ